MSLPNLCRIFVPTGQENLARNSRFSLLVDSIEPQETVLPWFGPLHFCSSHSVCECGVKQNAPHTQ